MQMAGEVLAGCWVPVGKLCGIMGLASGTAQSSCPHPEGAECCVPSGPGLSRGHLSTSPGTLCPDEPVPRWRTACWPLGKVPRLPVLHAVSPFKHIPEVTELGQWWGWYVCFVSQSSLESSLLGLIRQEGLLRLPASLAQGFQELGVQGSGPARLPLIRSFLPHSSPSTF